MTTAEFHECGADFHGIRHKRVVRLLHRAITLTPDERRAVERATFLSLDERRAAMENTSEMGNVLDGTDEAAALAVAQSFAAVLVTLVSQEEALALMQAAVATAVATALPPDRYDALISVAESVFGFPEAW